MPEGGRHRRALTAAALASIIDQASYSIGNFICGVLIARFLGVSAYGVLTLAIVTTNLAIVVVAAVLLDPASAIAQRYPNAQGSYARGVLLIAAGMAAALGLTSAGFFAMVGPQEMGRDPRVLAVVGCLAVAVVLNTVTRRLALATHRGMVAAIMSVTASVCLAGGVVALHMRGTLEIVPWMIFQLVVNAVLAMVGALVIGRGSERVPIRAIGRAHMTPSPVFLGINGLEFVRGYGPVLVLDHFAGPAAVGVFRCLMNVVLPFHLFRVALYNGFVPQVARRIWDSRGEGVTAILAMASGLAVSAVGFIGGGMLLWEDQLLLGLYGPGFHAPAHALVFLMAGTLLQATWTGPAIGMRAAGRLRPLLVATVLSAAAALCVSLLTTARLEVVGAVLAEAVGLGVAAGTVLIAALRQFSGRRLLRELTALPSALRRALRNSASGA